MTKAPESNSSSHDDFDRDLISIVAHDLKTPISAVKGFMQLIELVGPLSEQQQHLVGRAMHSLERMELLVTDLLDLSRIEGRDTIEVAPVDLAEIVTDTVEMLQGLTMARGISVKVNVKSGTAKASGDARWLRQVISNLLSNAIKYNRENGEVIVSLSNESGSVRLDVRDTGVGISTEDQQHIFEQFFRAHQNSDKGDRIEGTGLGLAITERIISKHKGRIWVTSEPGKGSTFSVVLPAAKSKTKSSRRLPPAMSVALAGESADGIDDSHQDSSEKIEIDSKSDEV